MVVEAEQLAEHRKRKRQSNPMYTLIRRSLYRIDGIIHLKAYRELPQMGISMGHKVLDFGETSMLVPRTWHHLANPAQRNLVKQIRPQYLRDVSSIEEFKSVFTQVIRCHRIVYMKTKGLHGSLSLNNFLFTRDGDGASLGCLDDWDPAKSIFAGETSTTRAAGRRAGEGPFMAIELLRIKPPPHLYRHDLESFFYILIWCALHFNLNGSEAPGINGAVVRWTYDAWDTIRLAKSQLFSNDAQVYRRSLNRAITPAFRSLARWIRNLTLMFDHGFSARKERDDRLDRVEWGEEEAAPDNWNEDTLNNHITYERFMAAIGEGPQLDI